MENIARVISLRFLSIVHADRFSHRIDMLNYLVFRSKNRE